MGRNRVNARKSHMHVFRIAWTKGQLALLVCSMKIMRFDECWIKASSIASFVLARFQQAFQFGQDQ